MTVPDEGARVVQIALHRAGDGEIEFQFFSRAERPRIGDRGCGTSRAGYGATSTAQR